MGNRRPDLAFWFCAGHVRPAAEKVGLKFALTRSVPCSGRAIRDLYRSVSDLGSIREIRSRVEHAERATVTKSRGCGTDFQRLSHRCLQQNSMDHSKGQLSQDRLDPLARIETPF